MWRHLRNAWLNAQTTEWLRRAMKDNDDHQFSTKIPWYISNIFMYSLPLLWWLTQQRLGNDFFFLSQALSCSRCLFYSMHLFLLWPCVMHKYCSLIDIQHTNDAHTTLVRFAEPASLYSLSLRINGMTWKGTLLVDERRHNISNSM